MSAPTAAPRSRRWLLPVLLALVIGAVLLGLVLTQDQTVDSPLDPRSPGPDGAEAVARVLDREDRPVTVVRDQAALLETAVDDAVVLVTNPDDLGRDTASTLLRHAGDARALVVVGSAPRIAEAVLDQGVTAGLAPREPGRVAADCDEPLVADLTVALDSGTALADPPGDSCFGDPGALTHDDALGPGTWLLTAPEVLANGTITEADNAAVALRLLGQGERVVWYVADPTDVAPDQAVGIEPLLPRWLAPGLVLLTVAGLAALLWRGRRLGPLVSEPLPVVVRAAESTHARGRLYRRAADRAHAAEVLREATRARLAHVLRLPESATSEQVADAVARRTGRDVVATHALLRPDHPPAHDTELADLGRRLSSLEDEVHHA